MEYIVRGLQMKEAAAAGRPGALWVTQGLLGRSVESQAHGSPCVSSGGHSPSGPAHRGGPVFTLRALTAPDCASCSVPDLAKPTAPDSRKVTSSLPW